MREYTRRPESKQARAANDASGAIIRLEEISACTQRAAQTQGFHIRKLWLGFNSSPSRAPYMAGKMGLLVNAVGNFDGNAFVPSKNQKDGTRRREWRFIFESAEASRERRC